MDWEILSDDEINDEDLYIYRRETTLSRMSFSSKKEEENLFE